MEKIFGGGTPSIPPPPPIPEPPPAPTIDDATKARENEDALRRRKGRAATVLTGSAGAGAPRTATKALLGE